MKSPSLSHTHTQTYTHTHTQHGLIYPTAQGALLRKYLEALVQELSPDEEGTEKSLESKHSHSLSSMKDLPYTPPPAPLPPRRSGSYFIRGTSRESSPGFMGMEDDMGSIEETEL